MHSEVYALPYLDGRMIPSSAGATKRGPSSDRDLDSISSPTDVVSIPVLCQMGISCKNRGYKGLKDIKQSYHARFH